MYDKESYQKELKLTNPTSMTKEEKEALEAKEIEGEKDIYKGIINKILDSPKKYSFKDFPIKLDTTFRHPQEVANISDDFCLLHEKRTNTFYLLPIEDYKLIVESYHFFNKLEDTALFSILGNLKDTPNPYIDYKDKENMIRAIKKNLFLIRGAFWGSILSSILFLLISLLLFDDFVFGFLSLVLPLIISSICIPKYEDNVRRELKDNIQYRGVYIIPSTVYNNE